MGLPTWGKPRPPTLLPNISPMRDEDPSCSPHKAQHLQKHLWSCYAKKNNPTVQRTSPGLDPHLAAKLDSGGAHPSRGAMLSKGTRERTTHRGGQPPGNREYFALEGGGFGLFLPFFELSFCCRAPPAPSGCKAAVTGPGRSPPLRSTPPNPRCQRILPQPDTSLDPLPVTSSSTLHLSS